MYGIMPQTVRYVSDPNQLLGCDPTTTVYVYKAAGTTREMYDCFQYMEDRGMRITVLGEKNMSPYDVMQYVCHICGQTTQTYGGGPVVCSHSNTQWAMYRPTTIHSPYADPGRMRRYDPGYDLRYDQRSLRYRDDGPCKKCSEGLILFDHIKESKDNYCTCEEGNNLRKKVKAATK
jgi:hypothetical protein